MLCQWIITSSSPDSDDKATTLRAVVTSVSGPVAMPNQSLWITRGHSDYARTCVYKCGHVR